jgi:hypothetical protein
MGSGSQGLDSDNYWEWSTRREDLLINTDLAGCLVRDGASLIDPAEQKAFLPRLIALALKRSQVNIGSLRSILCERAIKISQTYFIFSPQTDVIRLHVLQNDIQ